MLDPFPKGNHKGLWDKILLCIVSVNGILLWKKTMHTKTTHNPLDCYLEKGLSEKLARLVKYATTTFGWFQIHCIMQSGTETIQYSCTLLFDGNQFYILAKLRIKPKTDKQ